MIERTETPAPASTPSKTWDVAIVGAGYVGVPLACTFATAGRSVLLVDVLPKVVDALNRGESHIEDVPSDLLAPLVADGRLAATSDYDALRGADAILIALPTPLSKQREPDLSIVLAATQEIAKRLREGQLVVLESTTYPGTTREKLLPILESTGLKAGEDFNLAFSPERVDPGSPWDVKEVPKVVGGITEECSRRAAELYGTAIGTVHTVSSPEAAELTKLLENIFRSVNIALVNELAQLCDRMGIDVWEVVDAAATKPFGFMSFKPGPGLGGHCIPIDPFYLTWKAREFGFTTEFIELAGKVNEAMPYYCRSLISQALNHKKQKSMSGSQILVLGVAYKPDIGDVRESPALKLIELLRNAGASVAYHDPHVPSVPELGLESVPLDPASLRLRDDRDRPLVDRLLGARRPGGPRGRPSERDRPEGSGLRQGLEAVSVKVAVAGLGHWGKNLVRNFDDLAELRALCDVSPETREEFARRYPNAHVTDDFGELLADPEVEAVVIATPVPTHYSLAKQALQAGKHVFVEKPPAMRGEEMEELVALAEERELTLMPGHLLLYHPGVRTVKELVDARRARRRALRLRQPPEPRDHPQGRERALVARRPRPLRDPVPARRGAERGLGARQRVPDAGCRGRRLLLPALPERQDRAHAPVVARPAQDAADHRRRPRQDGRVRRHGARAQDHRVREGAVAACADLRRMADAHG